MQENGLDGESSFSPVWPPKEGLQALWLRTVVQEAFGDQTSLAPMRLKEEILKDEEVAKIFREFAASKYKNESEFIEAALGNKRWRRLLLEYLDKDKIEPDKVLETLKKVDEGLDKLKELAKKTDESLKKISETLSAGPKEPKPLVTRLKSIASASAATLSGAAVGALIGYGIGHSLLPIHVELDSNVIQPLSIPLTIKPAIDLQTQAKSQVEEQIPIALRPAITFEKTEGTNQVLKDGIEVPLNLVWKNNGTATGSTAQAAGSLEVHLTSECCNKPCPQALAYSTPAKVCALPVVVGENSISVADGGSPGITLKNIRKGEPACDVKITVQKVSSDGVEGVEIFACDQKDYKIDTLKVLPADPGGNCARLKESRLAVILEGIQSASTPSGQSSAIFLFERDRDNKTCQLISSKDPSTWK